MKTIVLCGGGTAGHIMPNIALLPMLRKKFNIHYIGDHNGMEKDIVAKYPEVTFHGISTVKLVRKFTLSNFALPFKLIKSINECKKILRSINPDIVFSKGGYVSVPVALAAHSLKIPVVGHESDYTMGLANKVIYRVCKCMCFSFENTQQKYCKKGVFTGSPIRPTLLCAHPDKVNNPKGFNQNKPYVLFMGGSLGARAINDVVSEHLGELTKRYNVLHITGKANDQANPTKGYLPVPFVNNIQDYMSRADVVVSRAGSNVIFELLYLGKPMILIPLPKDVSRGDQILNAYEFDKKGYAKLLLQQDLTIHSLIKDIEYCLKYRSAIKQKMISAGAENGNKNIVEQILKYTK